MKLNLITVVFLFLATITNSFAESVHDFVSENLSFPFRSQQLPVSEKVMNDEIIDIDPFDAPGVGMVDLPQFRMIFGYGSLSIFDALGVDEIAGLKRSDAQFKIDSLKALGKTEVDGAFIAGLTNIHGRQIFMFFNLERLKSGIHYANRVLNHEPLHLARYLITTVQNPMVDYIRDPYVKLDDDNEEYFAEVTERAATIAMERYRRIMNNAQRP